jgi:tripartite ATP-independent transporter DctM subunit
MYEGMNSFPLLAVPFFVMTGQFMLKGNLLNGLIDLVNAFFGRIKGALAIVTVIVCLLMGSIVGLAVAAAASLGSFLIPMMKEDNYSPAFASAVLSSASLLGPIMPPSVLMILYCIAVGRTSIAGIFLAAIVPALLITLLQTATINRIAVRRNYPSYPPVPFEKKMKALKESLPALLLPVIILGGIFGQVFTVSEAASISALYSFIVAFFIKKQLKLKDFPEIFMETALTTGLVIILAGTGTVAAWAIANEKIVDVLMGPLSTLPPWLFLLLVNVVLLVNGMFMDDYASIVILAPIIAPIAWAMGIHPLHIAVIICINLVIGLATPPFGIALFVTSPIAGVKIEETVKEALPMMLVSIGVLLVITFIPQIVLFLPSLAGY